MKRFAIALVLALALLLMGTGASAEALVYSHLGEILPDFSVQTADGGDFTLSGALAEKDMVLVNLWATWCDYCEIEFPAMQEAYEMYQDRVEIIALSIEPADTNDVLSEYAEAHGMTFRVANEGGLDLGRTFATVGVPTTLAIDRFGRIAFIRIGSMPSSDDFIRLFDALTGEDYAESRVFYDLPALPTLEAPDEAALNAALNAEGGALAFRNPEDRYTWPMRIVETADRIALASGNAGAAGSVSSVSATLTAKEGDALAFDFYTASEAAADLLVVSVDGEAVKRFGGEHPWTAWAIALAEGEHEIAFSYVKDGNIDAGGDEIMIDNVALISGAEADARLAALPVYPIADETALAIVSEDAREILFDDPENVMAASFGCQSWWIVPSGEARAEALVTGAVDPEAAYFYSTYDGAQTALSAALNEDGTGYFASTGVDAAETTGRLSCCLYLYPSPGSGADEEILGAMLFANEENVNELLRRLEVYGGVEISWSYADETAEREYVVRFIDQNGEAVPGCIVNFCSDDLCVPVTADENGAAVFSGAPYPYHLQVIRVPEGYEFDTAQEFYADEAGGEMALVVTKK